ncbi:ribonuclease H-like domain-containing protein [Tanacetum coccineum]
MAQPQQAFIAATASPHPAQLQAHFAAQQPMFYTEPQPNLYYDVSRCYTYMPNAFQSQATMFPEVYQTMTSLDPSWNMDTGSSSHLADNTVQAGSDVPQSATKLYRTLLCSFSILPLRAQTYLMLSSRLRTSRSSAEAEYRGVTNVVAETTWICNLLCELHTPLFTATLVYCDNVSAVYMSANPVQH